MCVLFHRNFVEMHSHRYKIILAVHKMKFYLIHTLESYTLLLTDTVCEADNALAALRTVGRKRTATILERKQHTVSSALNDDIAASLPEGLTLKHFAFMSLQCVDHSGALMC
jgi:hypothetical protein